MAARDVTSWLPNLLAPIDLQVNGEDVSVPKREIINIVGSGSRSKTTPAITLQILRYRPLRL